MELVNQIQILDKTVYISLRTNAFVKGMNPDMIK